MLNFYLKIVDEIISENGFSRFIFKFLFNFQKAARLAFLEFNENPLTG